MISDRVLLWYVLMILITKRKLIVRCNIANESITSPYNHAILLSLVMSKRTDVMKTFWIIFRGVQWPR